MDQLDFGAIKKAAEAAVMDGVRSGLAKVGSIFGGVERAVDETPERGRAHSVTASTAAAKRVRKPAPKAAKPEKPVKQDSVRSPRPKGDKRTPDEMAGLMERIYEFIKGRPGEGAETIAKLLGVETGEMRLPTKKLITAKRITTKGQKRATRYFPA